MKIQKERDFSKIEDFLQNTFSSPTHWPDWNLIISKYFNTDFFYFIAIDNGKIVGICPVHLEKKGILKNYRSGQFHFIPFGGWIFNRKVKLSSDFFPLESFSFFQSFSIPALEEFGTDYSNLPHNKKKTLIVDLRKDLEQIWKGDIHSKRRNMIRKAEKKGVKINHKSNYDSFYELYKEASIKSQLSIHPKQLFIDLFDNSQNINFDIITAELDGKALANVVISYDKDYSIYWLGNNADDVPNIGYGELLQWEAIKRMKSKDCSYYDLCYIEKDKLPHIYKFKSGFSKNEVDVTLTSNKSYSYKILNRVLK